MGLELITPPASEPVSLEQARAHLRVDHNDEDGLIARLIVVAREYVERHTGRALIVQDLKLWRDAWPDTETLALALPKPPLRALAAVTVYDRSGAATTLSSDAYIVDSAAAPGRIVLKSAAVLPAALREANAIAVTYQAGYGADASAVPMGLRNAILALIAHLYDKRGDEIAAMPPQLMALLAPFKVMAL